MTLPAWDPSDHSTFSIAPLTDLAYIDLGPLSSPFDLEQLAAMRSLFDLGQIPVLFLVPRAKHMPAWQIAKCNTADQISLAGPYVLAVARERGTGTLTAQWVDFTDGGRVATTDAQLKQLFTPYAGVNSAAIFVTRAPSPVVVSVSTVVSGVLAPGDITVVDLGVGATQLTASADKLMPPVSPTAGLTLTSDPTAAITCAPDGTGGVIVRTFAGSPSVPANLAFTVSWVA